MRPARLPPAATVLALDSWRRYGGGGVSAQFMQYLLTGLTVGAIYALVALASPSSSTPAT